MDEIDKQIAQLDSLIQKLKEVREFTSGCLHAHKYQALGSDTVFCECGSILKAATNQGFGHPWAIQYGTGHVHSTYTAGDGNGNWKADGYGASGEPL